MNEASGGDGIPVELFQVLKVDAVKSFTQYVSKFGKLISGHRTGKGQFSFNPKEVQCQRKFKLVQLCLFHMLLTTRLCSETFELGFSGTWTENFQLYKLNSEVVEEPGSNCQHVLNHGENKGVPEKHLLLLH